MDRSATSLVGRRCSGASATQKAAAMEGTGSQALQSLEVLGGAIPHMPLQSVAWKAGGEAADQGVSPLLGEHAGRRNRQTGAIATNQAALGSVPAAQRQLAIHQNKGRGARQALKGADHGPLGGDPDAEAVDLSSAGLAESAGQGVTVNQGHQSGPAARAQLLAVGEPCSGQQGQGGLWKHHGRCHHWTEETTSAHLVNPGTGGWIQSLPVIGACLR